MELKELIEANNQKRELLNKENEAYYSGLLIYIRTSFNKSERETEEILIEVLDHLLDAQTEGRTAEEVFGNDPKAYAREIVGELPTALPKSVTKLLLMMGCIFLGTFAFASGVLATILSYGFNVGESVYHFYAGSIILGVIASLLAVYFTVYVILGYLRWSAFRVVNKRNEMILSFLIGAGLCGLFIAGLYFMPSFGASIDIPVYWLIVIGAVLYGAGKWLEKKD